MTKKTDEKKPDPAAPATPAAAAPATGKKTYHCNRNVHYGTTAADARVYEEGGEIILDEDSDAAEELLACGAISDPDDAGSKPARRKKR